MVALMIESSENSHLFIDVEQNFETKGFLKGEKWSEDRIYRCKYCTLG